jgi:hypothetical protein
MSSLETNLNYITALCDGDDALAESLFAILTERRNRKKAADADSPQNSDRSASAAGNRASYMGTAAERRTMGGLFEPPTDDYTPGAGLGLDFTGGLSLPDETPSLTPEQAKQLGIFTELRRQFVSQPTKHLTADERKHRAMIEKARTQGREAGGMALPE